MIFKESLKKLFDGGNQLVSDNNALFGSWGFDWSSVSSSALKIGYTETKKSGDGKKRFEGLRLL
jgi:hypothetical protein